MGPFERERLRLNNLESQAEVIADMERRRHQRMVGGDDDMWQRPEPEQARPAARLTQRGGGMTPEQSAKWNSWANAIVLKHFESYTESLVKHLAEVHQAIRDENRNAAGGFAKDRERIAALEERVAKLEASKQRRSKVIDMSAVINKRRATG